MSIDLKTFCDVDISKYGIYKYAESDNFEILLFEVSINGEPAHVYVFAYSDSISKENLAPLSDETITKWDFNASFKRICLSYRLKGTVSIPIYAKSEKSLNFLLDMVVL